MTHLAASSQAPNEPTARAISVPLLGLIVGYAYYLRYRYWILSGGMEDDYLAWATTQDYVAAISELYLGNARFMAAGRWDQVQFLYPLGYPAIIAFVRRLGVIDPQTFRLVQIAADSLGCCLAYGLLRGMGAGLAAAVFAGFLYAIAPWWAWSSGLILAESLLPVLSLSALFVLLQVAGSRSGAAWFAAGFALGVIPLMRSEMTLLCLPLFLWALITRDRPWSRRVVLGLVALLGFSLPWLVAATYNYRLSGQFFIGKNVLWYQFYNGLGQVGNPYGYVTSDALARRLLQSMGLQYHSPESEAYWRSVYWTAWLEHPRHVLDTIIFRVRTILYSADIRYNHFRSAEFLVSWGPLLLLSGCFVLAFRRQYAFIFLLLGPLVYALALNGLMYVELRYVRYAHVSYILAAPLLLDGVLRSVDWSARRHPRFAFAKPAVAAAVALPLVAWCAKETIALDGGARHLLVEMVLRHLPSVAQEARWIEAPRWTAVVAGAAVVLRDARPAILTSASVSGYQAFAEIGTQDVAALRIDYDITVGGKAAYFGALSGDFSRFYRNVPLPAGTRTSGSFVLSVDPPKVFLVIQSSTKDRTEIIINSLRYVPICGRHPELRRNVMRRFRAALFPHETDWSPQDCFRS